MSEQSPRRPGAAPPRWVVAVGSLAIAYHLLALVSGALAAPSGPWPTPEGSQFVGPPAFAQQTREQATAPYLALLKFTHTYHFPSNRPMVPQVELVANVENAAGEVVTSVRMPDPRAPLWVRERQEQFVRWFSEDLPYQFAGGESIPAPGKAAETVAVWETVGNRKLELRPVPVHLVPRDRPVFRPTPWSLVVLRGYARRLCREHGGERVELIRHSNEPVAPLPLLNPQAQPTTSDNLVSNYGRFPR